MKEYFFFWDQKFQKEKKNAAQWRTIAILTWDQIWTSPDEVDTLIWLQYRPLAMQWIFWCGWSMDLSRGSRYFDLGAVYTSSDGIDIFSGSSMDISLCSRYFDLGAVWTSPDKVNILIWVQYKPLPRQIYFVRSSIWKWIYEMKIYRYLHYIHLGYCPRHHNVSDVIVSGLLQVYVNPSNLQ